MTKNKQSGIKAYGSWCPTIYAYTTPGVPYNEGWVKIGYTDQLASVRVGQQTKTAGITTNVEWTANAFFEPDSSGHAEPFSDNDFFRYLKKLDIKRRPSPGTGKGLEWFHMSPKEAKAYLNDFRYNRGILSTGEVRAVELRDEQKACIEQTCGYLDGIPEGGTAEVLWNAKPRFGKTLTAYKACVKRGARRILILTNRPAVADSWYKDDVKFVGSSSGLLFVSECDQLKGQKYVLTREQWASRMRLARGEDGDGLIEFVSLQDLKGSMYFGGDHDKLKHLAETYWDALIIDEDHEGVYTTKAELALGKIRRKFTIHMSGTPFKQLATSRYPEKAIYNWTYADEQQAKREWNPERGSNPYSGLPQLNLFTYKMSDVIEEKVKQGAVIDGERHDFCFDLNEFFSCDKSGKLVHDKEVDRFLDALCRGEKFPFSTDKLRAEMRHTVWMLNRIDSAKALERKLRHHEVFSRYIVVRATGEGKENESGEPESEQTIDKNKLEAVRQAIKQVSDGDKEGHIGTITLTVGQLTVGVTVPEWTGILMLSSIKSAQLYMQAAFRCQNPWEEKRGNNWYRKENAYVFDFDPARSLTIFEEAAVKTYPRAAGEREDSDFRRGRVRRLLNYFPVYAEDDSGQMVELDAERVLSIPRSIRCTEVVRRGFMCNYLFQNIGAVFNSPAAVSILGRLEPITVASAQGDSLENKLDDIEVGNDGEVPVDDERVLGTAVDVLSDEKIYEDVSDAANESIDKAMMSAKASIADKLDAIDRISNELKPKIAFAIESAFEDRTGEPLSRAAKKEAKTSVAKNLDALAAKAKTELKIEELKAERRKEEELARAADEEERSEILAIYDMESEDRYKDCAEKMRAYADGGALDNIVEEIAREQIKSEAEDKADKAKDEIRDHLRGFSRTIPSFLIAYGSRDTTLTNFERGIPEDVFLEVTSITPDEFRFLRDGETKTDEISGEGMFTGNLFDPTVFNDSVQQFFDVWESCADWRLEGVEDIFDYVPPQKTNQIFTPKRVVSEMIDLFENENPGCFDNDENTYIDTYVKSGLFLTEEARRLYNSTELAAKYPNEHERIRHILRKQLFGVAPSEIIRRIATRYITGPNEEICSEEDVRVLCCTNAVELASKGKYAEWIERAFG